ncbi:hypothetical protein QC760_008766 [Botrytis cinerea]
MQDLHCADILQKRGSEDRNSERIAATVAKVRADLGLPKKYPSKLEPQVLLASRISHLSGLNVTPTTPNMEEMIYCNSSCILSLEGETGPFYVSGEHIRSNLRETQAGVPLVIDGQFLDSTACEPIQDLYWDIWNCNSTGIYGGIPASPINDNFTSLFPVHYAGKTNYMHVAAHIGGTVLSNGTYTSGKVSHMGQVFFDQSLITKVEALSPFNINTQRLATNAADRVVAAEISSAAARLTANGGAPIAGGGRPPTAQSDKNVSH